MNNNKDKSWFFEKNNKTGKYLVRSNKERRINAKRNNIQKKGYNYKSGRDFKKLMKESNEKLCQ